jgi:nucleoid-associated protein YgaU
MRASIVRRNGGRQQEREDETIDELLNAVSRLRIRDLAIETAHGRFVIKGVAPYQLDRDQLYEAIKAVDGWQSKVVVDVAVERSDVRGYHTVAQGETLAAIAERYYGRASKETAIFEANRDRMNDPSQISPGQQLLIP